MHGWVGGVERVILNSRNAPHKPCSKWIQSARYGVNLAWHALSKFVYRKMLKSITKIIILTFFCNNEIPCWTVARVVVGIRNKTTIILNMSRGASRFWTIITITRVDKSVRKYDILYSPVILVQKFEVYFPKTRFTVYFLLTLNIFILTNYINIFVLLYDVIFWKPGKTTSIGLLYIHSGDESQVILKYSNAVQISKLSHPCNLDAYDNEPLSRVGQ